MTSWPTAALADVCDFENGDRGKNYPGKSAMLDAGIPFVNAGHLNDGSLRRELSYISEAHFQKLSNGKFKKGDILFCLRGSLGKFALVDREISGAIASSLIIIRPKGSISPDYLKSYLGSKICEEQIDLYRNGAAQPNLAANSLRKFEIPLPPFEEQRRIAAILDKADALRRKRKRALELLDGISHSIFVEMFGDPTSNPNKWPTRYLGELVKNESAKRIPIKSADRENRDGKYPYYGASGIIDQIDDFLFEGRRLLIAEDGANLLSRSTAVAFFAEGRFWVNNHAHVLAESQISNLVFLRSFIEAIDLSPYITGSAQPKLNRANMDRIPVHTPPLQMQIAYENRVKQAEAVLTKARQSEVIEAVLFSSLQSRAFSGQL